MDPTPCLMITLVVDGPEMEQIIKQLYKLVNTVKVTELGPGEGVVREIMLLRVNSDAGEAAPKCSRVPLPSSTQGAVDVGAQTASPSRYQETLSNSSNFLELMRPYGVIDLVKSGRIAMPKDPKAKRKSHRFGAIDLNGVAP